MVSNIVARVFGPRVSRLNFDSALALHLLADRSMADKNSIRDLLEDEIKDLYSAEKQLTKAIPKMAKGSSEPTLQTAFRDHLEETQNQVSRLEEVARMLQMRPTGKKCEGMEGVIQEGAEALQEEGDDTVLDLGIIGAGSRVEHYEIAGYLTAISLAQRLGAKEAVALLKESLAEEEAAEQKLRKIAANLIKNAPIEKPEKSMARERTTRSSTASGW
jgi:ferritin-like metal-binding protein YciE